MAKPVIRPELVTTTLPPLVVTRDPLRMKLLPTRVTPAGPSVFSMPLTVARPVDDTMSMEAA